MPEERSKIIRDTLHGYVRIARYERIIVDHPITQRLRNVTQTGLAQLVYPEARTSRFSHSLGAMHIASRFLVASLENSDPGVTSSVFEELLQLPLFKGGMFSLTDMDLILREALHRS
jgi:HD superfamily phosphohydrolase